MRDRQNWPNDYDAPWSYLSYLPGDPGALDAVDQKLGAAGMSVDRAWTTTIGKPSVVIGILGSGIDWSTKDLLEQAALNQGELGGDKRPQNANGEVCENFDCNGDGAFTIADYAQDPRFAPVVPGEPCASGADRQKGDLNRNCVLDPGDLVLMFSDGVDDDANGYTDDICGWDFFKNDNDPYDDTKNGTGTDAAKLAVARANNGDGLPGTCPGCTYLPIRVGDAMLVEANDFAKGLLYATDRGARVAAANFTTLDHTELSKAAIDYAYSKGTVVVAGVGNESSRHHAMPASANHVLAVGSLGQTERSYADFDPCSNFGGQLAVSVSGTPCGHEAVGRAAGIAGLLFAAAGVGADGDPKNAKVSAEEAIQLFKSTASDIVVPESGSSDARQFFSQAGFDQRFGYGRINAARIVTDVAAHLPPEIDITAPDWFVPVHGPGSVRILGRVAASRARSYDLFVQWAAGAAPADGDYRDIVAPAKNIPAATVTGNSAPIAVLDPAQLDLAHKAEPDSTHDEDVRSVSLRVRAIAHYDDADVVGEARRVISVTNEKNGVDEDLLPGFPLALGASIEGSPKLADIDGDGIRDIVIPDSSGRLHVFAVGARQTPTELPGFPYLTRGIDGLNKSLGEPTIPSYFAAAAYSTGIDPAIAREALVAAPAIADIDGDGRPEIVFTSIAGTIYVVNARGQDLPGWPQRLPLVPSCPLDPTKPKSDPCMDATHTVARGTASAPVLVDLDGDGKPEIVVSAFDGRVWAFEPDGTPVKGFPVSLLLENTKNAARIVATPAVVELDDGTPGLVVGTNQDVGGGAAPAFVIDRRGRVKASLTLPSARIGPLFADGLAAAPAIADFDGDGRADIVLESNGERPRVIDLDAQPLAKLGTLDGAFGPSSRAIAPDVMVALLGQPAIGDLDQDGVPDIVASGSTPSFLGPKHRQDRVQHLLAMWSGKTGAMLPGAPIVLEDTAPLVNPAIADVSGDDYPEVISGTGGYYLHAADGCGREAPGFPKLTGGWIAGSAAVGNVDGDAESRLDVVVGTRDGYLFAWKTKGRTSGAVEWESFHHDNANTGSALTRLEQGTRLRAATPLVCTPPEAPKVETFDAGGGCACHTTPVTASRAPWPLLAAFGLTSLLRCISRDRRRRRCASRR